MSLTYQSPPVSPETAAHLVHLFCMSDPYRLAYMAALQLLRPDDPHWQDIVAEVSRREDGLLGRLRPADALILRQTLPPIYGRALDGTRVALKPISPHRKELPIGHLPYVSIDPWLVPCLYKASLWDVPWFVADRGGEDGGGLSVKIRGEHRRDLSARKAIAELALGRPLDPARDGRVYSVLGGHPGDLRLSQLVLAKPGHRAPRIGPGAETIADLLARLNLPPQP